MHDKDVTNSAKTFGSEKREIAAMIDKCLQQSSPNLIGATEDLSGEILVNSNGSATKIILSQVVHDLTVRGVTDLRRHLASLAKYLRESPDEPIHREALVERILRSSK